MNIAVTGYYGTGSSAVLDFLSEFKNNKCAIGNRYEHYSFLGQNAIIDLENRLFSDGTNYMIRDYAINQFLDEMNRQYKYNFGWFGSYKKLFGEKFINSVNKFVDAISVPKECRSFTQVKKIKHTPLKAVLQIGARIILKRKIYDLGRVYVYDKKPIRFLMVNHEEFMKHAKIFINEYFEMCQIENYNMIYDHLLLPEQAKIVNKFFDGSNFKLIIVDRDPRDVYLSSKYYWSTLKYGAEPGIYPNGIENLCKYWQMRHDFMKDLSAEDKKNVLFVQFEDLVYKYDETAQIIMDFCGLKKEDHLNPKSIFNPDKSVNNTQVFYKNKDYLDEANFISNNLKDFIYKFPYDKENDATKIFTSFDI